MRKYFHPTAVAIGAWLGLLIILALGWTPTIFTWIWTGGTTIWAINDYISRPEEW